MNRAPCYPPVFVFRSVFPYCLVPLVQDSPNPKGIMSSKASGEPCLMLSTGILTALQNAVAAARAEFGGNGSDAGGAEKVCRHAGPTLSLQMSRKFDVSVLHCGVLAARAESCGSGSGVSISCRMRLARRCLHCLSGSVPIVLLATAAKPLTAMRTLIRSTFLPPAFTQLALSAQAEWHALTAPATTVKLRRAVGDCSVADMLEAALKYGGGSGGGSLAGGTSSDGSWEML